ncbi:succinylglutamate desuccinylase [Vibrio astriarenae]|uniref:succinylglutamate desuccinylase n=1 Tax=Vibrio astriarenae TaxID=1481923 RepID=UPI000503F37A|nr:succinylglutamate desuccinylase [Vibrio sp. C7]
MTSSPFQQSFLKDTLDLAVPFQPKTLELDNGTTLKLLQRGVVECVPADFEADNGKHIIVSTGIHGDETAPLELVDKIVEDIASGFQSIQERTLFIIAHPEATTLHQRFVDENLNRLFDSKSRPATTETQIADNLKTVVSEFYQGTPEQNRWHLDLHCAIRLSKHYSFAVSPKTRHPVRSKALFEFVELCHVEAVLLSNAPSSTFSWFSAEKFGAQAMTIELGQVAKIGENQLDKLMAFDMTLRDLIARIKPEHHPRRVVHYRVSRTIVRMHDDFDFMFGDDVENFTEFKHGEVFGHDGDKPLMAKNEGEAVVFPNRHVAIGQRAALMVCPVRTRYDADQLVYD